MKTDQHLLLCTAAVVARLRLRLLVPPPPPPPLDLKNEKNENENIEKHKKKKKTRKKKASRAPSLSFTRVVSSLSPASASLSLLPEGPPRSRLSCERGRDERETRSK